MISLHFSLLRQWYQDQAPKKTDKIFGLMALKMILESNIDFCCFIQVFIHLKARSIQKADDLV